MIARIFRVRNGTRMLLFCSGRGVGRGRRFLLSVCPFLSGCWMGEGWWVWVWWISCSVCGVGGFYIWWWKYVFAVLGGFLCRFVYCWLFVLDAIIQVSKTLV